MTTTTICASTTRLRRRVVFIFPLAIAFVVAAAFVVTATANAAFTFSGYALTPSTTQAAGHPGVNVRIDPDAAAGDKTGDDLKTVRLDFPAGMLVNPEAVAASNDCTTTSFNADKCPAASQIGTISVKYLRNGAYFTAVGSVYKLTPDSSNVIAFGFVVRPSGCRKLFLRSSKVTGLGTVRTGIDADYGLTATVDSIPRTLTTTTGSTLNVTIADISVNIAARSGSSQTGAYFMFNPTRCTTATSRTTVTSYQGVVQSRTSSFVPTGCGSVPFTPTATVTPLSLTAGSPTGINARFTVPTADAAVQQSHVQNIRVTLPRGTSLNLANIGAVAALCDDANFAADTCPAGSKIGTAAVDVPFLPPTMSGDIYLMARGMSLSYGIVLRGARSTRAYIKGTASLADLDGDGTPESIQATLPNLPQIPFSATTLTFTTQLVNNPTFGCDGPTTTTSDLAGYSGATASVTTSFGLTGCIVVPDTSITSPAPVPTNATPTFTFTSDVTAATFECAVDSAPFSACASPYATAPLTDGTHTFAVRAVNSGVPDPTPASVTFTIALPPAFAVGLSGSVSTTQAAGHPDVTAQIDVTGGDDVKSLTVNLPYGLQGSGAAVPLCSQSTPSSCTASSQVGTQTVSIRLDDGSTITLVGAVYLTYPANLASAAGVLIVFPGYMAIPGDVQEFSNGGQQRMVIPNIPNTLGSMHLHVTRIVTNLSGGTGAPSHPFLTNPSSCTSLTAFTASATSYGGLSAAASPVPYMASGCSTVPFSPTVTQEFSNPVAGETTGVKTTVTVNQGDSSIKSVRVTEPPMLGPNYPAFGDVVDQCPSAAAPNASTFDPSSCPPQSKVGHMTVNTLLLPLPLEGDVYLVNKTPLPWFGVRLSTIGVDIRLVGAVTMPQVDPLCDPLADYCPQQLQTTFSNLPDQPMTQIVLDLNGPDRVGTYATLSGNILTVAAPGDPQCVSPASVQSSVSPITSAAAVNSTQGVNFSGC